MALPGRRSARRATAPGRPAAASLRGDWILPHWLERQRDPSAPTHVVQDEPENVTARNWTAVGNLDSPARPVVDARGLVTPAEGGWSLDWWIGADDRWHLPSREVAVRQRLVGDAPVVETLMRVPSGDVAQRVYGVRDGGREIVVVEIENRSPIPVALAMAVRPYGPDGLAGIRQISMADDVTILVDGTVALVLPKAAAHLAGSTAAVGDVATAVLAGEAGTTRPEATCEEGLASAAFVLPLAHRTALRFALPLPEPRSAGRGRRTSAPPSVDPAQLPTSEQVANGWQVHGSRGVRLVLPDARLQSVVDVDRRYLLLQHDDAGMLPDAADVAAVAGALERYGLEVEAAELLAGLPESQSGDGSFPGGTGAALHALAEHWRFQRDGELLATAAPAVAAAAEHVVRRSRGRTGQGIDGWGVRGLLDAAELLGAAGEEEAAAAAARYAAVAVAGAGRSGDPGDVLDAVWPLGLLAADDPRAVAAADELRSSALAGAAVVGADGLDPRRTLQLAAVELEAGDRRALDRLGWLLDVATPTWTWPSAISAATGGGVAGSGHDPLVTAGLLTFVRRLLVRETLGHGLALCSMFPADWLGQGVEVHDAPTHHGTVSFAVRWHGDRPALLWDLAAHPGAAGLTITAPGLDPTWSSTDLRGDALLAPVAPPSTPVRLKRR